ncbi:MAG TPA: transporter substrate-binding domain-containing protein [Candidatus Udaeobacter sp.]|nr:transporter substrate-binding domain-containing protein [Candidatus Udaeobacter sp.]
MRRCHHLDSGWVLLAIFLAGIVATVQGQSEPTLALLRSGARPLVVGGVSEYTPFNVVGPDGQLTGMDREIIRAAAKRLGIKQVDFKTITFSKLGPSLLDGKIDLIANNYWPTPDRERLYAFTMPYFVRGGVGSLWIEGTGPFDTAASMAGKRIAVLKGSYPEAWAREHVPTAIILPVDGTLAELDDRLRTGQADVEVGFYTRQRGVLLKHKDGGGYKNALLQPMRATFAVRKGAKELREALDGVLKEMWADGSLNKIKRVYLDPLEIEPAASP